MKWKTVVDFILERNDGYNTAKLCRAHFWASFVMGLTALVLTVLNVRIGEWFMAGATALLTVGMGINMYVTGVRKNHRISVGIMVVLSSVVFSVFVLVAGNEGFASLWMLMVPLIAVTLLGVFPGVVLSLYFLVFLLVVFYTPLKFLIAGKYTVAFLQRFPVLYACDMCLSLFTTLQKEFYVRRLRERTFCDELTGAYNRNYFLNQIEKAEIINSPGLAMIMIDVNGLKTANDTKGHTYGDELLIGVVGLCKQVFGKKADLFRMGGDEFALMLDMPRSEVDGQIELLRQARDSWKGKLNDKLEFAIGVATREEFPELNPEDLMKEADNRMYADKAAFYTLHDRRAR